MSGRLGIVGRVAEETVESFEAECNLELSA